MAKSADLSQFQVRKPGAYSEPDTPAKKPRRRKSTTEDRKLKGFRIRKEAAKQLAMLKIETGKDEQDLVAEALNLLFKQYKRPQIA